MWGSNLDYRKWRWRGGGIFCPMVRLGGGACGVLILTIESGGGGGGGGGGVGIFCPMVRLSHEEFKVV